jgi:hypothetical protein
MHLLLQDPAVAAAIHAHRAAALNPAHPQQRGGAQGTDILMQMWEASNRYYLVRVCVMVFINNVDSTCNQFSHCITAVPCVFAYRT